MVRPEPLPHRLYLGKDDFLKKESIAEIKKQFFEKNANASLNWQEFSCADDSIAEAVAYASTAPFLADRRVAVLWSVEDCEEGEKKALLEALAALPTTAELLLVTSESNVKKDEFIKKLADKIKVVPCHPPFDNEWPRWAEARLRKRGKRISPDAVELLLEKAGRDSQSVDSAAEQLSVYAGTRENVDRRDVETLLGRSVQADAFELIDKLIDRDARAALECLENLLREGSRAPEIVGALAGQYERLCKAAQLVHRGMPAREAASQLKVHPYYADKFAAQAKRVGAASASSALRRLLACDEAFKTGRLNEKTALERLVLELCAARDAVYFEV